MTPLDALGARGFSGRARRGLIASVAACVLFLVAWYHTFQSIGLFISLWASTLIVAAYAFVVASVTIYHRRQYRTPVVVWSLVVLVASAAVFLWVVGAGVIFYHVLGAVR